MKEIQLTHGKVALVDDEDYEWLCVWNWQAHYHKPSDSWKARRFTRKQFPHTVLMHRVILDAQSGQLVDHIDHDGLNNTRGNLRIADYKQNGQNRYKQRTDTTSQYKGVSRFYERWQAAIMVNKKSIFLGHFESEEEAALAYDNAAREHFGEFALTNTELNRDR